VAPACAGIPQDLAPNEAAQGGLHCAVLRPHLRRFAANPFAVFAVLALAAAVLIAIQRPWIADFWMHAATVDRLRDNLWHPGNPVVAADTASPYYTPYTWLLAVLSKLTGMSAVGVLTAWAPVNVAILLAGVWAFARQFSRSPWLPVVLFLTLTLLWGAIPLGWSGFLTLFGLPLILAYPSTFAFGLTLLLWAMLLGRLKKRRTDGIWWWGLGLGAFAAFIVLSHPFVGLIAALGALAILVARLPLARATSGALLMAAAVTVALVAIWPYYSIFDLTGTTSILDGEHLMLYESWRGLYGYAIVTVPFVALRLVHDRRDPIVLMFVAGAVPVAYGAVTGHWSWGRIIPLVLFAGQAATAIWIVDWFGRAHPLRSARTAIEAAMVAVVAVACLAGLRVQFGNLLYVAPLDVWPGRLIHAGQPVPIAPAYDWITEHTRPGDVVLAKDRVAQRTIPAYGVNLVAPAWPDPLLRDEGQRHADQAAIFDPSTDPLVRQQLLSKYHVRWVLTTPADGPVPADLQTGPAFTGPDGQTLRELTG
jgi:hypothetical protein